LGLSDGLLRYIALYRGKKETAKIKEIFRSSLALVGVTSIISSLILFLGSEIISIQIFHNPALISFLRIFSIIIPFTTISYLFLAAINAYEKIGIYSFIINIFQNIIKLLFLTIFIFFGVKAGAVAFSYLIGVVAMFILSYLYCRYNLPGLFGKYSLNKAEKTELRKCLFSYSWPLMFFSLFVGILPWIDTAILGYFKNAAIVGIYNAAVPLAMLLNLPSEIFMRLFFPLITREYSKNNYKLISELSKQVGKWTFMIDLPVLIVMLLFPGAIINFFFGADYLPASNALRILSIGFFVSSLFFVSDSLVAISGRSKINLMNVLFSCLVNLILNILLVPKYGMLGSAVSTMFSFIFLGVLRGIQSYWYLKIIPLKRKMFVISLISLILAIALYYIRHYIEINTLSLIIIGSVFCIFYIALLFAANCFDKNDWLIINSFKKKLFYLNAL
jgi:O-antigen/teichoic acid export membrane protein